MYLLDILFLFHILINVSKLVIESIEKEQIKIRDLRQHS